MPAKTLIKIEPKVNNTMNDVKRTKERNISKMTNDNHSNLEEIQDTTDLDRLFDRLQCPQTVELHKEGDLYGKGSIVKKGVDDIYGGARQAIDLNFKLFTWTGALGRTMGLGVRVTACVVLLLTLLVTCHAAPAHGTKKEEVVSNILSFYYN
jgi:hypothetical protein